MHIRHYCSVCYSLLLFPYDLNNLLCFLVLAIKYYIFLVKTGWRLLFDCILIIFVWKMHLYNYNLWE